MRHFESKASFRFGMILDLEKSCKTAQSSCVVLTPRSGSPRMRFFNSPGCYEGKKELVLHTPYPLWSLVRAHVFH